MFTSVSSRASTEYSKAAAISLISQRHRTLTANEDELEDDPWALESSSSWFFVRLYDPLSRSFAAALLHSARRAYRDQQDAYQMLPAYTLHGDRYATPD